MWSDHPKNQNLGNSYLEIGVSGNDPTSRNDIKYYDESHPFTCKFQNS
jgi:hypothetical protein